ncbi:hypothetical protein CMK14_05530 [Candidatus Poribacteria bacterium]|nr:hypothetical protein [Candidatus Poribacteria bacterium]
MQTYKHLFEASAVPRTATLAIWETQSSTDADYKIWLAAQDELEHTAAYSIKVRVDNTLPTLELESPIDNQRVLKQVVFWPELLIFICIAIVWTTPPI